MSEKIFFKVEEKEVKIEHEGEIYTFRVRGLSCNEETEILTQCIHFDSMLRKTDFDLAKYNRLRLAKCVKEAVLPSGEHIQINEANVKNLRNPFYDILLREIDRLSDIPKDFLGGLSGRSAGSPPTQPQSD